MDSQKLFEIMSLEAQKEYDKKTVRVANMFKDILLNIFSSGIPTNEQPNIISKLQDHVDAIVLHVHKLESPKLDTVLREKILIAVRKILEENGYTKFNNNIIQKGNQRKNKLHKSNSQIQISEEEYQKKVLLSEIAYRELIEEENMKTTTNNKARNLKKKERRREKKAQLSITEQNQPNIPIECPSENQIEKTPIESPNKVNNKLSIKELIFSVDWGADDDEFMNMSLHTTLLNTKEQQLPKIEIQSHKQNQISNSIPPKLSYARVLTKPHLTKCS